MALVINMLGGFWRSEKKKEGRCGEESTNKHFPEKLSIYGEDDETISFAGEDYYMTAEILYGMLDK